MSHPVSLDFSVLQAKLFLAVAEFRSFSRAAEAMRVEQSTLSRRIAILEQELGLPLFNRESRPIRLTPAGEMLLELWKPLVAAFEHSLYMLYEEQNSIAPTLSVCVPDSGTLPQDPAALSLELRRVDPEVALTFRYIPADGWEQALQDGSCDLALLPDCADADLSGRFSRVDISSDRPFCAVHLRDCRNPYLAEFLDILISR